MILKGCLNQATFFFAPFNEFWLFLKCINTTALNAVIKDNNTCKKNQCQNRTPQLR